MLIRCFSRKSDHSHRLVLFGVFSGQPLTARRDRRSATSEMAGSHLVKSLFGPKWMTHKMAARGRRQETLRKWLRASPAQARPTDAWCTRKSAGHKPQRRTEEPTQRWAHDGWFYRSLHRWASNFILLDTKQAKLRQRHRTAASCGHLAPTSSLGQLGLVGIRQSFARSWRLGRAPQARSELQLMAAAFSSLPFGLKMPCLVCFWAKWVVLNSTLRRCASHFRGGD